MNDKEIRENFPEDLLSAPVEIRLAKAKDPDSSPEVLSLLAKDRFWFVRDFVASNIKTPRDSLELLCNDADFRVRIEAAKNLLEQSRDNHHKVSLNDTILASQVISSCREAITSSKSNLSRNLNGIDK